MRCTVFTELSGAADEGMRNWVRQAEHALRAAGAEVAVVRPIGDPRVAALRPRTWRLVRASRPDALLYVPYSGLTRKALLRFAAIRAAVPGARSGIAVLQAAPDVTPLPIAHVGVFGSERLRQRLGRLASTSVVAPPVVDVARFRPVAAARRAEIRQTWALASDRPVVLHVGHIRPSRNLEPLAQIARSGRAQVVVVGSTSTPPDAPTAVMLSEAGVRLIQEFIPQIEDLYRAADVYVFPVTDPQGCIETPLSVFESLACGTPVVCTPFGALPELLDRRDTVRFAAPRDIPSAVDDTVRAPVQADPARPPEFESAGLVTALAPLLQPRSRGRLIALIGIDGTGKSTQAQEIVTWAHRNGHTAKSLWCRWDPRIARPAIKLLDHLSRSKLVTPGTATPPRSDSTAGGGMRRRALRRRLLSCAPLRQGWRALIALDYGVPTALRVRLALRSNDVVVVDRYWHDVVVDLSAGEMLAKPPRALRQLLPEPDVLIALDLDEVTALRRKPDSPDLTYLRQRRELYRRLGDAYGAITIDATPPPREVTAQVLAHLAQVLAHLEPDSPARTNGARTTEHS